MQQEATDLKLSEQVNVRLSEGDYQTLLQIATEEDRSITYIVRRAVQKEIQNRLVEAET